MILLIDNYDSFSYNLYQLIAEFNDNIKIIKNDELTPEEINLLNPSLIVISPGPGKPEDAGNCIEIIKFFKGKIPIFGVCLGYQAIAKVYGGNITYAKNIMHGKTSDITFDSNSIIFRGLKTPIKVARYHSLALEKNTISNEVDIIAYANDGELMAFEDKKNKIYAVQFHPESILTPDGKKIISNIINNNNMIKEAIKKLSNKENLSYLMAESAMNEIMNGQASEVQKSAYLTALSLKGETIEEITASAKVMRNHCIKLLNENEVLEIVGTGGDGSNSFNISTTSSIVIAAAGVSVAKHGNKASSSKCGAADCLNELGVKINISPEKSKAILKKIDICFLFAQNYHLAMKYVAPVRKELGIKTIFNILGPLTNPAGATMQLMGVYDESLVLPMAEVLRNLGVKRALVVYGMDKLDEISLSSETKICELKDNKLSSYTICPEDFGFSRCHKNDLAGGDPKENADITKSIFKGKKGPKRDAVILNSGAALYIANKAKSIEEGCKIAENIIDSGKALKKLEEFIELTNA